MRRLKFAASLVLGMTIGAITFNLVPARAQLAVIDVKAIAQEIKNSEIFQAIQAVTTTMNATISDIKTLLSPTGAIASLLGDGTLGSVTQLLHDGFTQLSNYAKGQIGAFEQLFDASNTSMARFHRDVRNAQMRDEHTPNPM